VFHNHQPVGNFGWVFKEVFEKAYAPMVSALEAHPSIRVGLHYTGPLLEWLESEQPEFLPRLGALVARDQVEILGGGLYEPILVSLPQRDRHAQLVRMRAEVARLFGTEPSGAWLAERVWEPSLPFDLAEAGYAYTVLDDNHLRGAAVRDDDMWGTYNTDDQGRRLTIFGTEKGLRYRTPFRPVNELIAYLRDAAAASAGAPRVGIMGDDGEKFGAWPGTYELCWGNGRWIEDCFTAIEKNASWLATTTPSGWMADNPPLGRIYVPTASYVEMTEWALPPADARAFHAAVADAEKDDSAAAPFLRGAMWRNFLARYREINDVHKQMLRASAAVDAMPRGPVHDEAADHLLRGQSNDCYWHGLFGGIYIVHMRVATLAQLIAAEDLALGADGVASGVADYDLDGVDEVLLGTTGQTVLVDVAEGAGIGAWDLRASRVALASVLRRRPEAYHEALREMETAQERGERSAGVTGVSIHDQLMSKESGLSAALVYDDHERRSGLVRVLDSNGLEAGDFVNGSWELDTVSRSQLVVTRREQGIALRKTVELDGDRRVGSLVIELEILSERGMTGNVELEMNVNLSGGGGNPDAYYRWQGNDARHDSAGRADATGLRFGNERQGVDIALKTTPPAAAAWSPIETVSNSEAGFEKVYQGSCLLLRWPLQTVPGENSTFRASFSATQSTLPQADVS
jgi:alpha-amylase